MKKMSKVSKPYGDDFASKMIADRLENNFFTDETI